MVQLLGPSERDRARAFIEAEGLAYEDGFDDLVGAYERGVLVGVGARSGGVLKMIAIAPSHQGGAALGQIVTELVRLGTEAGRDAFFVFTRPDHVPSFEALGFALLASQRRAALLELGDGLRRWLAASRPLVREGENGAVVVNCNPFTRGHRHLIEEASRRVEALYVFVVREDRSAFPFAARRRLVEEGTADLRNVHVLDTSHYAVSAITFPAYFLKQTDDVAAIQMELDVRLFGRHVAPFFHVRRRFIGSEPFCATTRAYNETMRRVLPSLGVEPIEVERLGASGEAISASRVRDALRSGEVGRLEALVPPTTLRYLRSPDAAEVWARLAARQERHA